MTGHHHIGEHVQFKFRSGTRAGFIRKIYTHPEDPKSEHIAVGKQAIAKASKENPAYLVEIEKNGSYYVKTASQLSKVSGESGLSEKDIKSKDKDIKSQKTSGKRKAMEAEPAANAAKKKRAMATRSKRPRAK